MNKKKKEKNILPLIKMTVVLLIHCRPHHHQHVKMSTTWFKLLSSWEKKNLFLPINGFKKEICRVRQKFHTICIHSQNELSKIMSSPLNCMQEATEIKLRCISKAATKYAWSWFICIPHLLCTIGTWTNLKIKFDQIFPSFSTNTTISITNPDPFTTFSPTTQSNKMNQLEVQYCVKWKNCVLA